MNIKLFKDTFKTLFLEDVAYNNVKDAFKNNLWQPISPHCGIIDLRTKNKKKEKPQKNLTSMCKTFKSGNCTVQYLLRVYTVSITYTNLEARLRSEHTRQRVHTGTFT